MGLCSSSIDPVKSIRNRGDWGFTQLVGPFWLVAFAIMSIISHNGIGSVGPIDTTRCSGSDHFPKSVFTHSVIVSSCTKFRKPKSRFLELTFYS